MERTSRIVILLLMLSYTEASNKCKITQREIECRGKDLESMPKFQNSGQYENLDMSDNDLDELFKADFYNFTNLKHLRLNFNEIAYIEDNAFENLVNLKFLDLSKNILEEVPDEMITENKKLVTLDLSGNLFNGRTPCLASESLEQLDLSMSKISYFNEENIANLPNLKILNLSSNNLVSLDADLFKIPKEFVSVDLYYNTWECSCEIVKMLRKLTQQNYFVVTKNIMCFRGTKIEEIYGRNGVISKKLTCDKKRNLPTNSTQMTINNNATNNNDSLINGIKSLEEILKMEKIYYQELRKEKDVLVSVTTLTMKILIVVIFITGISLGILISTVIDRRISRIRRRGIYRSDSFS